MNFITANRQTEGETNKGNEATQYMSIGKLKSEIANKWALYSYS